MSTPESTALAPVNDAFKQYRMTQAEFDEMLKAFGGASGICDMLETVAGMAGMVAMARGIDVGDDIEKIGPVARACFAKRGKRRLVLEWEGGAFLLEIE